MHFACAAKSYSENPGKPCLVCSPLAPAKLWDEPLNFSLDAAQSSNENNKGFKGMLSDLLDKCIDSTDKDVTSGLPVATLRHKHIMPESVIKRHGTNTLNFLVEKTRYSPQELVAWGFTYDLFLKAGLSPRHCIQGQPKSFFQMIVGNLKNLLEVFSGNHMALAKNRFSTETFLWLTPEKSTPAKEMAALGFKAPHLLEMRFTIAEWQNGLGLTGVLMREAFEFDYDSCFALIHQDPSHWPEFKERFGFLPISKQQNEEHIRPPAPTSEIVHPPVARRPIPLNSADVFSGLGYAAPYGILRPSGNVPRRPTG